ncbi:DNA-binding protein [Delftia lacustris]
MKQLRTAAEARAWLDYQGITISQWSRENNVHHGLVREILAGRKKCLRGMSHNIAVLLGMKDGVLTDRPARVAPAAAALSRGSATGVHGAVV